MIANNIDFFRNMSRYGWELLNGECMDVVKGSMESYKCTDVSFYFYDIRTESGQLPVANLVKTNARKLIFETWVSLG